VVLVGDAFATSCPAGGTGTDKVFTDVAQLCNLHIPQWLSTSGMGADKIASFYDDPVKQACDAMSIRKAFQLRSLSTDSGLGWRAQRLARFAVRSGQGLTRRWRRRLVSSARAAVAAAPGDGRLA
jgi:2-polyprenyl-6-methoxyphenol hydroxylase-like FAD-dependent oxidoreductase